MGEFWVRDYDPRRRARAKRRHERQDLEQAPPRLRRTRFKPNVSDADAGRRNSAASTPRDARPSAPREKASPTGFGVIDFRFGKAHRCGRSCGIEAGTRASCVTKTRMPRSSTMTIDTARAPHVEMGEASTGGSSRPLQAGIQRTSRYTGCRCRRKAAPAVRRDDFEAEALRRRPARHQPRSLRGRRRPDDFSRREGGSPRCV